MRRIWSGLLATTTLLAAGGAQAWASPPSPEAPPELIELPAPVGLGRLVLPVHFGSPDAALPAVVILPDALGEDGRAEPYAEALSHAASRSSRWGWTSRRRGGGSAAAARLAVDWASRDARLDAARIGLLGLGAGARSALGAGAGRPVVALYPGCRGLELAGAGPALILYGTDAGDASACAGLAAPSEVELRPIPGAGHGWDVVGTLWLAGMMLPDPAGNGRVRALPNPRATLDAAEITADHFDAAFGASRSAER
jgi:dienelactone hydrolase